MLEAVLCTSVVKVKGVIWPLYCIIMLWFLRFVVISHITLTSTRLYNWQQYKQGVMTKNCLWTGRSYTCVWQINTCLSKHRSKNIEIFTNASLVIEKLWHDCCKRSNCSFLKIVLTHWVLEAILWGICHKLRARPDTSSCHTLLA